MKHRSIYFSLGLVVVLAMTTSSTLFAQSAAETLQQKVGLPQQAPPPTPVTTNPADLGQISAVQQFPKPDVFTVSSTQQYFHTDNAFYTQAAPLASSVYLGTYSASLVPYSLVNWTPRITAQYNMARYGKVPLADFNNMNLAFSSQYIFTKDRSWSWTATIDLSNYNSVHGQSVNFYREVVWDNQITKVMPIGTDNNLFFIGAYGLTYHQASPAVFDRLDNSLSFSLSYYPRKDISVGPYVRPATRTYFTNTTTQHDRDDFNLSEGVDVTYQPCQFVALSADVSNTNDWSSTMGQSYNVFSPGVSVTGTYKF